MKPMFADPNSTYVMQDPFPYEVQKRSMFDSPFSTGLVPYPCTHGIPRLQPDAIRVAGEPRLDKEGCELPPYGGLSWGRSKHLRIKAYGAHHGIPFAIAECVVCQGEPRPEDMTDG